MSQILHTFARMMFAPSSDAPTKPNLPPVSDTSSDHAVNRTPTYRWHYFFTNLLLLLISGGSIVTILLLLLQQQDHEFSTWRHDISLHALTAWLATLAKLTLLIPLAECIGQAKWTLFHHSRRKLSDLDIADSASRNPLGALGWILRFRGGVLVHFGAALVVVAVCFEPAVQHLLHFDPTILSDPAGNASLSINRDYSPVRGLEGGLIFEVPKILLFGAYSSVFGQGVTPKSSCSSGNCTFPSTIPTLGFCSSCTDITSQLTHSCRDLSKKSPHCPRQDTCFTSGKLCTYLHPTTNITIGGGETFFQILANGANFQNVSDDMISLDKNVVTFTALFIQPGDEDPPDEDAWRPTYLPIAPGHVSAKNGVHKARAFTCAMSYCEHRLHSSIVLGVLHEKRVVAEDSHQNFTIPRTEDFSQAFLDQRFNLTSSNTSTQVSLTSLYTLSRGLAGFLTGNASMLPPGTVLTPDTMSKLHWAWYQKLVRTGFNDVVAGMAESMSAAIRNDGGRVQEGTVWVSGLFLRVKWEWVALPGFVWVGTMVLLLLVTVKARKKRSPWLGSSQLASTFIDLEKEARMDADNLEATWCDKGGMRKVGERFRLRVAPVHSLGDQMPKLELTRLSSPM